MWSRPFVRACLWFTLGAATAGAASVCWLRWHLNNPQRLRSILLANPQFLADSPEVLAAVRAVLRVRQLDSEGEARQRLMAGRWGRFVHVAFSPSVGNPAARSILVEFTDYGCEPCRASAVSVLRVLEARADLRVAIMLLPTSGPLSEFAARVGYVSYRQNPAQFARFHELLMHERGELSESGVLSEAAAAGLDVEQIQQQLGTGEAREYLAQVRRFADELQVSGVPTFAIGKRLLSGGLSTAQIADLVESQRAQAVVARPQQR